jgi:ribosome biogenesis GTPase
VSRPTGRYTDQDVEHYERPRRRTRPRTKERPTYDDAVDGVVLTVDRGRFTLLVDDTTVLAVKARPLGRKGVVVGDRVRVVGDVSGDEGALARIVEVSERSTVLRRTADDDDPVERVVVANADQLVVVTALADPEPRPRLIDRALVAAYDAGMSPLLCLTKSDLADPETLLSTYRSLGVPWVVTHKGGDLSELRARLDGRASVLVGHSGVGKSTLVNALVPDADREIGHAGSTTRSRPAPPTPTGSRRSGGCSPREASRTTRRRASGGRVSADAIGFSRGYRRSRVGAPARARGR